MKKKIMWIIIGIAVAAILGGGIFMAYQMNQLNKLTSMSSDDMINYVTENDDDVKISVAIINNGEVSYHVYGKDGAELDRTDYDYEIGSISKTFATMLVSKAVGEGKISLDDTIDKYLDLEAGKNYPTIRDLVTHTSGYKAYYFDSQMISNKLNGQQNDFYGIGKDKILDKVKSANIKDEEHKFVYSNFGISVVGLVLESVYGEDFTEMMNDFIADELGLLDTEVRTCKGNLSGYLNWAEGDGYIPAGAIISDIEDMAKYLEFCMTTDEDYAVNSFKSLKKVDANDATHEKMNIRIDEIGMGWKLDTQNGITWHNGVTSNFNSYIGFNREKKVGVVILSNLPSTMDNSMTVLGPKIMLELMQ